METYIYIMVLVLFATYIVSATITTMALADDAWGPHWSHVLLGLVIGWALFPVTLGFLLADMCIERMHK